MGRMLSLIRENVMVIKGFVLFLITFVQLSSAMIREADQDRKKGA